MCLLAWDATAAHDADIAALARKLLLAGCAYILCWGPDCERVHDVFDAEEASQRPDGPFAISTWHTSETFADVLWQALFTAFPGDPYEEECRSTVCLVIGRRPGPRRLARRSWTPLPSALGTWMKSMANKPLERPGAKPCGHLMASSAGRSAPIR